MEGADRAAPRMRATNTMIAVQAPRAAAGLETGKASSRKSTRRVTGEVVVVLGTTEVMKVRKLGTWSRRRNERAAPTSAKVVDAIALRHADISECTLDK